MGTPPGTIKRFTPPQAKSTRSLAHQSLHEADLLKVIEMSGKLGNRPERVVIFGIEPEKVTLGQSLSKPVYEQISFYISVISGELGEQPISAPES